MSFQITLQRKCVLTFILCTSLFLPWNPSAFAVETTLTSPSADEVKTSKPTNVSSPGVATSDTTIPQAAVLSVNQLVRKVLAANPSVDAMRAGADAAHAGVESADALADPVVSYLVAPNTAGGPGQGLNQNLQISQRLPWPGTFNLRSRAAAAVAESADENVKDIRLRLEANARSAYAQWFYVYRALAINAENLRLLNRLQAVAEAAYASGQSQQQDVLQAKVEIIRLQNQTLELQRMHRTVQAKINALQNLSPDTIVPPPEDLEIKTTLPAYSVLRDIALSHYPMLQGFGARVKASRDGLQLAHKNNYPHFNLIAGYNSLMDAPAKRFTVGVGINIPFGGNHRGEVDAANARVQQAEAKLDDARNQLLSHFDQAYATADQAGKTISLYTRQLLPLAKINLQAAEADYSNGTGDFLKLIKAEQQYLMAKLELARARADFFTQRAVLDYQTGGAL